jgi:hypothetical protein
MKNNETSQSLKEITAREKKIFQQVMKEVNYQNMMNNIMQRVKTLTDEKSNN